MANTSLTLGEHWEVFIRNEVSSGLAAFSSAGYFAQHMWGYFADIESLLYEGKHEEAVAREKTEWVQLRASGMMRIQLSRVLMAYVKGQVTVLDPQAKPARSRRWRSCSTVKSSNGRPRSPGCCAGQARCATETPPRRSSSSRSARASSKGWAI